MADRKTNPFPALSRRSLLRSAGFLGVAGAAGGLLCPGTARAADPFVWMGWQGYDVCFLDGAPLGERNLSLSPSYINANEDIIIRLQAGGVGQVDLATIYFGYLPILIAAGLLEPIDESRLGVLGDIFPEFLRNDTIRHDGKLYGIPVTWGSYPMVYDPAATAKPTSWKDCLKPEYKGKVLLVDDPVGLVEIWAPIVTGTATPTRLTPAELTATIDFLIDIKKNHARALAPGYGEAADMFARGEVVISAVGWEAMVAFAAAKGKTLEYVVPAEGTAIFMDCLCIPKDSPHLDAAYAMIETCLSPQGQKPIADELTQAVVNRAAAEQASAENRQMYQYGHLEELFKTAKLYPFFPLEPEEGVVSYDEMLEDYQRFQKA